LFVGIFFDDEKVVTRLLGLMSCNRAQSLSKNYLCESHTEVERRIIMKRSEPETHSAYQPLLRCGVAPSLLRGTKMPAKDVMR
jgi:hypothetical protein